MKKILLLGLVSLFPLSSWAQHPGDYIKWESDQNPGTSFKDAYTQWTKGTPLYQDRPEDENFFISRVRIRDRFRNAQTQVNKSLTEENDKNVFNWLPIGAVDGHKDNALPSGIYDSDVFSMWSYITHWGNWTAPMIRVPGAFMDVVHKNGVKGSSLASIPWNFRITGDDSWGQMFNALINGGADKFINFLKYYGIDGWGMNSEFQFEEEFGNNLQSFMADVYQKSITERNYPSYVAAWYTLVGNSGYLTADGLTTGNSNWYHKDGRPISNYVFGNYNWGERQLMQNDGLTTQFGRDPREVYAGMNIQGAQGRNWTILKNHKTSIGLWGAHNMNIFFEGRNELGSTDEAKQSTYQTRIERFFSNGNQNPAKTIAVSNMLSTSAGALKEFHGVSAMATAKSTLSWNLSKEAFYTYFNLGNGKFFNLKGERAYEGEWYNIAMQDYLPTWRYWFSTEFLGNTPAEGLSAKFSWEDAWFGGSCFEIKGTANSAYLQLFKTKYELQEGDKITVRYKVLSGTGEVKLVTAAEGSETTAVDASLLDASDAEQGEWEEKVITVSNSGRNSLSLVGQTLAVIALKFENANNLNIRLGALSIERGSYTVPSAPTINNDLTKVLKSSYKGVDAKINFSMVAESPEDPSHIYNDEAKTSFFKLYSKQGDGPEHFVGATTSWAALIFYAPIDVEHGNKIKFGVSAVGLDGVSESSITWSDEFDIVAPTIEEGLEIDKPTIKPNQEFTVKYTDSNHADAQKWEVLRNGTTEVLYSSEGGKSFTHKLADIGMYDLKVTDSEGNVSTYPGYIQITKQDVGAVPEIRSLTFNSEEVADKGSVTAEKNHENTLAYTGAPADGVVSRGLDLKEGPLTIPPTSVGITRNNQPWTLSMWVKFSNFNGSTQLLNVRDGGDPWPRNNWGFVWSDYNPENGSYALFLRASYGENYGKHYKHLNLKTGVWTHMTYVFSTDNGRYDMKLYVNGKYVPADQYQIGSNKYDGDGNGGLRNMYNMTPTTLIMFGGSAFKRAGVMGIVDDVKLFNKALTAEEVAANVYNEDKSSADLIGYWDFENSPSEDNSIPSVSTAHTGGVVKWGELKATGVREGETTIEAKSPSFDAGSPFLSGTNFRVTTVPTWTFPKGRMADATGNDQAGSAKITYPKSGMFKGTLTLTNSWSKASRTISAVNITIPTGVEMTDEISLKAFPNPFVETVNIRFPEAGRFVATIYDVKGGVVSQKVVNAGVGSVFTVNLNAPKGLYLLRVTTPEGKLLRTLKLIKK